MEQTLLVALIAGLVLLAAGIALHCIHRGAVRKRNDFRIRQALVRGLANPDGVERPSVPLLQW